MNIQTRYKEEQNEINKNVFTKIKITMKNIKIYNEKAQTKHSRKHNKNQNPLKKSRILE